MPLLLAMGRFQWEGLESRNAKGQHECKLQNRRGSWAALASELTNDGRQGGGRGVPRGRDEPRLLGKLRARGCPPAVGRRATNGTA